MIDRVQFRNFKALRDVSLDLERLTVLVGPNASGKTSILEGLHYLMRAARAGPGPVFDGADRLRRLSSAGTNGSLELSCSGTGGWVRLGRDLQPDSGPPDAEPRRQDVAVFVDREECYGLAMQSAGNTAEGEPPAFGPDVFLRLDIKQLLGPSYSETALPQMADDGDGLASVLAYLSGNQPERYQWIFEGLQEVVPIVRELRFPRAEVVRTESEVITIDGKPFTHRGEHTYWGNSIEFDMQGAARIRADMVSEGTLLVLGLLTAIMGPNQPRVVLLDDLDRALHPKAQGDLVALLRRLLERNPEMQIVATSHSPYLLDHLRPEEVRLTTLKDDGSVACARLDEHPEFEKWKETMAPGEFWSMVGEKWVAEAATKEPA
jgi:energy-coupling factor transporter ATP-binding protein EcfA2